MIIKNNSILEDVVEISIDIFEDYRGMNTETYNKTMYTDLLSIDFHTDTMSRSRKNVLRGLHGDFKTHKLVQSLYGTVFLVIVDFREQSETYLKHTTFTLSDTNRMQILIPPGFLNGHVCMTNECIFSYKLSTEYNPLQISIKYDDPSLDIHWPIENPILSERDRTSNYILQRKSQ